MCMTTLKIYAFLCVYKRVCLKSPILLFKTLCSADSARDLISLPKGYGQISCEHIVTNSLSRLLDM